MDEESRATTGMATCYSVRVRIEHLNESARMTKPRTAYELSKSQVSTPPDVVSLFWKITKKHRPHFRSVLDMGAGDCRLAKGGSYDSYTGVEIDAKRALTASPP